MGTMSRCNKWGSGPAHNPRSTKAKRLLTGQRLMDVLTVINQRQLFNRQIRRLVFNLWKRHAWAYGYNRYNFEAPAQAVLDPSLKGLVLGQDHPAAVSARLLGWAA